MNRWRVLAAVAAMAIALAMLPGCDGRPVTLTEDLANFTRVDVQNAFDIEITQAATFSVTITTSKNLLDYLSVSQEGDTLRLKLTPNHPFTDFILMRKTLKARVTMPAIRGVGLSGASHGSVTGFESSNDLNVTVSGASSLDMNKIKAGDVDFEVSGASRVRGTLTAGKVKMLVSGASKVELFGSATDVEAVASGASRLKLQEFVHKTARVNLSGASEATIDAREQIAGRLEGASRLFFLSNPSMRDIEVTGASTIKHK